MSIEVETAPWPAAIDRAVAALEDRLIHIRRHLHAFPELSGAEFETTRFAAGVLHEAGLECRLGPGERGVIVDGGGAAPARVAVRGDIDALPIAELRECPYRSQRPGLMHACGHDAHTTIGLGVALVLAELQESGELPCAVPWRVILQPAEETLIGAYEMTVAGALDGVDAILSLHMDPSRQAGRIGVRAGAFTANCDTVKIEIKGQGGHGARPHESIDPIAAAAHLINALYAALPRAIDSQDAVVLSFGHVAAGESANVIPSTALLRGTLRTLDRHVRERALERIKRIADGIAATTGTQIEVSFPGGIGCVFNDAALTALVRQAGHDALGRDQVEEIPRPSMGSEDFAAYLDHVPGCMFRLGCASPAVGNSALHTPTFDIDERSLSIGVRVLARAAILRTLQRAGLG